MTQRARLGPSPRRTMGSFASWFVGIFAGAILVRLMSTGSLPVPGGVAGLLVLAAWALLWWRFRQRGVYVSMTQVWVCRVFRTWRFPLASVIDIDTVPSGREGEGIRRLVLGVEGGQRVAAPLRGYARGHDDPTGPLDVLPAADFGKLLEDLRLRAAAAPATE
jgi:hypothetical protein